MKKLLILLFIGIQTIALIPAAVPLGRIWERADSLAGSKANRVCGVDDSYHVMGNGGAIWKTDDDHTWLKEETANQENLYGIVNANGTLVVVGAGGQILSKPPGGLWGAQPSGTNKPLRAITYAAGHFVAVGDSGTIVRSADGVNWSIWQSGFSQHLYDVIWDGSLFRAVGQNQTFASAAPGGTWSRDPQFNSTSEDFKSIAFGGPGYVINGTRFSADGQTWSNRSSTTISDVARGVGHFIAIGQGGILLVSENGTTWTSIQTGSNTSIVSVKWTGSEFAAITETKSLLTSADGYPLAVQGIVPLLIPPSGWSLGRQSIRDRRGCSNHHDLTRRALVDD